MIKTSKNIYLHNTLQTSNYIKKNLNILNTFRDSECPLLKELFSTQEYCKVIIYNIIIDKYLPSTPQCCLNRYQKQNYLSKIRQQHQLSLLANNMTNVREQLK